MYNTSINAVSGIPDYQFIIDVISDFATGRTNDEVFDRVVNQNIHGIRTWKSRERFFYGIKSVFLQFQSEDHQTLFYSLFQHPGLLPAKKMALFFQFAVNNKLFYDLSVNVFLNLYQAGRVTADKAEFTAYLYELREHQAQMQQWSTSTIEHLASKYLTFLKKLDFLKGRVKKEFNLIMLDDVIIVYLIYLIKAIGENGTDILKNPYIALCMLNRQELIDRLKKLALQEYFSLSTLGYDLKIELTYPYKEIVNVIAQGTQS